MDEMMHEIDVAAKQDLHYTVLLYIYLKNYFNTHIYWYLIILIIQLSCLFKIMKLFFKAFHQLYTIVWSC